MFELLKRMLTGQSQFASGGLLLMIIGGISVYLRAIPMRIWQWLEEQITLSITIKDDDAAFYWVKEWFLEQQFLKRIRRLDVDTTLHGQNVALIPAPGQHWFWRAGRPFQVGFYRTEDDHSASLRRRESLIFRTLGRKQVVLRQLVNEVAECHRRKAGVHSYLYVFNDGWTRVEAYVPRLLQSVVLKPGEKERLMEDITLFRKSRKRYRDLGVPYHRGYLFYGPPGTGKTSIVSALAGEFGMSIYAINLAQFNDRSLAGAMNELEQNSVILFEDIDCMKSGDAHTRADEDVLREKATAGKDDRNGVTLSGLLNLLDGFSAPDNVLFVMTSNQIEALDPALLRPGRIDFRLFLGHATEGQKVELYRRFFPHASLAEAQMFVESNLQAKTMAEFQGLLLALESRGYAQGQRSLEFELDGCELIEK